MNKKNCNKNKTNNGGTNWAAIISDSPHAVQNFASGNASLRDLVFSLSDPNNRRAIYAFERPGAGGTSRARKLARNACRRHGLAV